MKKEYISPILQVVKIQQTQMLCASPQSLDDEILDVLQDDEDDIQDLEDIW
jgi:hypothetical protein